MNTGLSLKKTYRILYIGIIISFFSTYFCNIYAQSNQSSFRVFPKSVLLDNEEYGSIEVQNIGNETREFRIELVHMIVGESDRLITAPDSLEDSSWQLGRHLRFGPRYMELAPRQKQAIRFATRFPDDQEAGEYRAHILIRGFPADRTRVTSNQEEGLRLDLRFIESFAIPIVAWYGDLSVPAVEISEASLALTEEETRLSATLNLAGNRSVSGNIDIYYYPEQNSEGIHIRKVGGVVIYADSPERTISVLVDQGKIGREGQLQIVYSGKEDGEEHTYAQTIVEL